VTPSRGCAEPGCAGTLTYLLLGRELCWDGGDGGEVRGRGEEHVAARSCVAAVSGGRCARATVVCLRACGFHIIACVCVIKATRVHMCHRKGPDQWGTNQEIRWVEWDFVLS
jgi:hypothetical protein